MATVQSFLSLLFTFAMLFIHTEMAMSIETYENITNQEMGQPLSQNAVTHDVEINTCEFNSIVFVLDIELVMMLSAQMQLRYSSYVLDILVDLVHSVYLCCICLQTISPIWVTL
jgi:hypothetical protein